MVVFYCLQKPYKSLSYKLPTRYYYGLLFFIKINNTNIFITRFYKKIYIHVQKLFLLSEAFDKAMIMFIRRSVANFLKNHRDFHNQNTYCLNFIPEQHQNIRNLTICIMFPYSVFIRRNFH